MKIVYVESGNHRGWYQPGTYWSRPPGYYYVLLSGWQYGPFDTSGDAEDAYDKFTLTSEDR